MASLNQTEDELIARISSRLKVSGNGGSDKLRESSSGGRKRGRGRGKGHGSGSGGRGGNENGGRGNMAAGGRGAGNAGCGGNSGDVARDECRYCGGIGHWARECKKRKRDEQAHAAQAEEEDEEFTLLVASATVDAPLTTSACQGGAPAVTHLNEPRLFVQLGEKEQGDDARWILDSGATNHMTGAAVSVL
jgi:hypothetical protein